MALRTINGLAICNKDDYEQFFNLRTNNGMKNPFSEEKIKKIIEDWYDLVLANDDLWAIYWDMLRQAIQDNSEEINAQCANI